MSFLQNTIQSDKYKILHFVVYIELCVCFVAGVLFVYLVLELRSTHNTQPDNFVYTIFVYIFLFIYFADWLSVNIEKNSIDLALFMNTTFRKKVYKFD